MRRQARELVLQLLFQREFGVTASIKELGRHFGEGLTPEGLAFAEELFDGIQLNKEQIDARISQRSQHWSLERMGLVDRNVLRIAVQEMFFSSTPPPLKVIINEAVELVKKYGSTDSGAFVNGVLDGIQVE